MVLGGLRPLAGRAALRLAVRLLPGLRCQACGVALSAWEAEMGSELTARVARRAVEIREARAANSSLAEEVRANTERMDVLEQGLILAFQAGGADVPEVLQPRPQRPDLKVLQGGAA